MYQLACLLWGPWFRWRYVVEGQGNLPTSPFMLIVQPHEKLSDPWLISAVLRTGGRPIRWLATVQLFDPKSAGEKVAPGLPAWARWPLGIFVSFVVRHSLTIPIARASDREGRERSMDEYRELLRALKGVLCDLKGIVGLFPQGGRHRPVLESGFLRFARQAEVPIVPVTVNHAARVVVVGKPFLAEEVSKAPSQEELHGLFPQAAQTA